VHFVKAGEAEPNSVEAQTGAGRSLMKLGQFAPAHARFLVAANLGPQSFAAHSGAGDVCLAMGRLNEATQWYVKALALKPESYAACSNLGSAYLRMGKFDVAIEAYRRAVQVKESSDSAHHNLATALREKGMLAEAIDEYRKAIDLAPAVQRSRLALAWLLSTTSEVTLRDGAEAVRLVESVQKGTGGRDAAVLEVLAAAYAEAGRFDEAVSVMERAIKATPTNADALTLVDMRRRLKLFTEGQAIRK
jgi:tetratricopeptide (TPR) repeat protein